MLLNNDSTKTININNKTISTQIDGRYSLDVNNTNTNSYSATNSDSLCPKAKVSISIPSSEIGNGVSDINLSGNDLQSFGTCKSVGDYVKDINREMKVTYKRDNESNETRSATLNVISLPQSGKTTVQNYSTETNENAKPNVWIVSHGMNDSAGGMDNTTSALANKYPNDVVLALDWRGAEPTSNMSSSTDEAINPTAKKVVERLKMWGFTNTSKLNLVGHSMGTIMSQAISNKAGGSNRLIALDPPKATNITNQSTFTIDNNTGETFTGFSHPNSVSLVAASSDGSEGGCGNNNFARTTTKMYKVVMQSIIPGNDFPTSSCPTHVSVKEIFAKLLRSNNFDMSSLSVTSPTGSTNFNNSGNAILADNSNSNVTPINIVAKYDAGGTGAVDQYRFSTSSNFSDLSQYHQISSTQRTIKINDMTSSNKIELSSDPSNYTFIDATIKRDIKPSGRTINYDALGVQGSVDVNALNTDLVNLKNSRSDIKYFTKR